MPPLQRVIGSSEVEGGLKRPKFLKECMSLNWNFQQGGGLKTKKTLCRGVWIFSGTTQCQLLVFVVAGHNSSIQLL